MVKRRGFSHLFFRLLKIPVATPAKGEIKALAEASVATAFETALVAV